MLTNSRWRHSASLNGPVPIGLSQLPSGFSDERCVIAVMPQSLRAILARKSEDGSLIRIATVSGSTAVTLSIFRPISPLKSVRQRQPVLGLR